MAATDQDYRRILIVDDSEAIHEDFRKVLAASERVSALASMEAELFGSAAASRPRTIGFEVHSAFQGRDAYEMVRAAQAAGTPFAVAFVDMRMPPGWDGLETIQRLWEVDPALEVVICTAYSDHSWGKIIETLGQTDRLLILKKPFQADEARQLALALTTKRRLNAEAQARRDELEQAVSERTAELAQRNAELQRVDEARAEHARVLTVLLEYSNKLAQCERVEDAVRYTLRFAAMLTHCRRVSVMVPDGTGRKLYIAGAIGIDERVQRQVVVPVGDGIAGSVFAAGSSFVVNNPGEYVPRKDHYESEFFASVPLVSRALVSSEHTVGVLNLTERDGNQPFTPREIETIDVIGNMAASALDDILARRARDEARDTIVSALATLVECRDGNTGKHLERVTGYSLLLAEALRGTEIDGGQITADFLEDLRRAVPLHDIGKVGIPDSILLKPGPLTPEEMAVMKRHTLIGEAAVRSMIEQAPTTRFLHMALEIASGHHERFDGTGYPRGIPGRKIPLSARIASLADVYDALTTVRVYKPALPHQQVLGMIAEGSGKQFDPVVVQAFLERAAEFEHLATTLADADTAPPLAHDDAEDAIVQRLRASNGILAG
ncbi:MAG: HD domain-containing protein [Phycisphaerales bacterium]|nr:HD domain-containing protein [Phycisphaerales bacterium]